MERDNSAPAAKKQTASRCRGWPVVKKGGVYPSGWWAINPACKNPAREAVLQPPPDCGGLNPTEKVEQGEKQCCLRREEAQKAGRVKGRDGGGGCGGVGGVGGREGGAGGLVCGGISLHAGLIP